MHPICMKVQAAFIIKGLVATRNGAGVHNVIRLHFCKISRNDQSNRILRLKRGYCFGWWCGYHSVILLYILFHIFCVLLLMIDKARTGGKSLVAIIEGANVFVSLAYELKYFNHPNPCDYENEHGVNHCAQIVCCIAHIRMASFPCASPTESPSPKTATSWSFRCALSMNDLLHCEHTKFFFFVFICSFKWFGKLVLQNAYYELFFQRLCGLVVWFSLRVREVRSSIPRGAQFLFFLFEHSG